MHLDIATCTANKPPLSPLSPYQFEVMRITTASAITAFLAARPFKSRNTKVEVSPNVTTLYLFGNAIAYLYNDPARTLSITNAGWQTNTTKERLNGIPGVSINQRQGVWYLNGSPWDGKLIDIPA